MTNPTRLQIRLCYEVDCFTGVHGRAPTFRELGRLLRTTHQTAWMRARYAQKKGLLADGLVVTDLGRSLLQVCA